MVLQPARNYGMKVNVQIVHYQNVIPFHEDLCINALAQVVNMCEHVLSQVHAFTTRARVFMHKSL